MSDPTERRIERQRKIAQTVAEANKIISKLPIETDAKDGPRYGNGLAPMKLAAKRPPPAAPMPEPEPEPMPEPEPEVQVSPKPALPPLKLKAAQPPPLNRAFKTQELAPLSSNAVRGPRVVTAQTSVYNLSEDQLRYTQDFVPSDFKKTLAKANLDETGKALYAANQNMEQYANFANMQCETPCGSDNDKCHVNGSNVEHFQSVFPNATVAQVRVKNKYLQLPLLTSTDGQTIRQCRVNEEGNALLLQRAKQARKLAAEMRKSKNLGLIPVLMIKGNVAYREAMLLKSYIPDDDDKFWTAALIDALRKFASEFAVSIDEVLSNEQLLDKWMNRLNKFRSVSENDVSQKEEDDSDDSDDSDDTDSSDEEEENEDKDDKKKGKSLAFW
jgi:hypothetical protein